MGLPDLDNYGDLAIVLADEFQEKWLASLDEDMLQKLDEVENLRAEKRKSIFTKMDFRWRPADRVLLEHVRISGEMTLGELYQEAFRVMDGFYAEMRVPVTQIVDGQQVAVLDDHRRQVFEKDDFGNYVENIEQLTGQDIEKAILDMGRVRFIVSRLHAQLLSEAILARSLYDDRREEGYASLVEGTQGDRNAKASRDARRDKFKAYFHWHLYQLSNAFLIEINSFVRTLDRMVDRRAWTGSRRES